MIQTTTHHIVGAEYQTYHISLFHMLVPKKFTFTLQLPWIKWIWSSLKWLKLNYL